MKQNMFHLVVAAVIYYFFRKKNYREFYFLSHICKKSEREREIKKKKGQIVGLYYLYRKVYK